MKVDPSAMRKARSIQEEFFAYVGEVTVDQYDSSVADEAGISRSMFSQMKSGKKPMSLNSMFRIARAVNLVVTLKLSHRK